jgi:choline dehydrogenase-like flavoprotein
MGIPVIVDLPVGDNLQDHASSGLSFVLNDSVSYDLLKASTPYAMLDYYLYRKNELTSNLIEGTMFVKTKYEDQSDDWPDIQLGMIPGIHKQITQFILFM